MMILPVMEKKYVEPETVLQENQLFVKMKTCVLKVNVEKQKETDFFVYLLSLQRVLMMETHVL